MFENRYVRYSDLDLPMHQLTPPLTEICQTLAFQRTRITILKANRCAGIYRNFAALLKHQSIVYEYCSNCRET